MRKSLSGKTPPLSGDKGMDRKKMKNIAIGTTLGVIVVLVIAVVVLTVMNKPAATATPTPAPSATPTPVPTATPTPTSTPEPAPASGQVYSQGDHFLMSALLNGNTGQCRVRLTLAPGAVNQTVSNLTMSVVCDGRTYDNVWTLKPMDWDTQTNDTVLGLNNGIVADIDTKKLGIPQGRPITIKVLRNADFYQEISLAPTYE